MRLLLLSRRAFLAAITILLTAVTVPLRDWLRRHNPLVGNWRILEYICDGKRVTTEATDVTITITDNAVSTLIRMHGHPDHVELHNYSIRCSTREVDIEASNGGMFLGVYSENPNGLILAWDTVGQGRPRTVEEPQRFGLNRMVLTRDDARTLFST